MLCPPTPKQVAALTTALSPERMAPFRKATGSQAAALELYIWNLRLSAAFSETIAIAEVVLRNAMHRELTATYGQTWYCRSELFDDRTLDGFAAAWRQLNNQSGNKKPKPLKDIPPGKFVAEVTFGTWLSLLDAGSWRGAEPFREKVNYENTLWRKALHRAFPNSDRNRKTVYRTARIVRAVRNRVAHHEPLINGVSLPGEYDASGQPRRLKCDEVHNAILELVRYIDLDVHAWLCAASRVPEVLTQRPRA